MYHVVDYHGGSLRVHAQRNTDARDAVKVEDSLQILQEHWPEYSYPEILPGSPTQI
jgi:hypothetical protein